MAKIKTKFDSTLHENILTSMHDPLTLNYNFRQNDYVRQCTCNIYRIM